MNTQTLSLSAFLEARIAEDQDYADRAGDFRGPRLVAECEAKRNLVNYAAFMLKAWDDKPGGAYPDMTRRERHTANVILDHLAAVYDGHPDYDEEWRP